MLYKVVGDTKCFADNKAQENQIFNNKVEKY